MPNIFEERDESKLVQQRDVKPVKSNQQPKQSPPAAPPAQPEPAPAPEQPQQPEQQAPAPSPEQSIQENPFYQAPIPFAAPLGYEPVQSSPYAFQQQAAILDSIEQAAQAQNTAPIMPLVNQTTIVNPGIASIRDMTGDPQQQAQQWTDEWTGEVTKSWDKYVTHTNVGMNPATQFDPTGKPIRQATQQEIKTGLNGLMSELGQSLQNNFDKGNWFSNTVRSMKGLVPMVTSALEQVPGVRVIGDTFNFVADAFSGNEAYLEENKDRLEAHKKLFYANVRGDMNAASDARKILQNNPIRQDYNDYGEGALGGVFRAISTPTNLVKAAVYEYADGWRQFVDHQQERSMFGNIEAGLAATVGTLGAIEPEHDKYNRYLMVLQGRNLESMERFSDEKYLTFQEPAGVEVGQMTGNWWWDLPENITSTITGVQPGNYDFKTYMGTAMLHNVLQGLPSFVTDIVVDAPFDAVTDAAWGIFDIMDNVRSASKFMDDVPLMEVRPYKVGELPPANQLALPSSDFGSAAYITVDVPATTVIDDVQQVADPWSTFEVVADPWDITPNTNKAQTHMVTLDSEVPQLIPSVDLDFVYRSNDDLARLANRMGIRVEPTDASINQLIRENPTQFTHYGKPVHPEIENFNTIILPDTTVKVQPVAPLETLPLPDITAEQQVTKFNSLGNNVTAAQIEIEEALKAGSVPKESAIVKYQEAKTQQAIVRDELPPEVAYKENVHQLPPQLHTTAAPEAVTAGTEYIGALQEAETASLNAKQLINNYNQLNKVDSLIDTKLSALPNVGYEDFHDIQATMGQYGADDMMDLPLSQDVPEPKDLIEVPSVKDVVQTEQTFEQAFNEASGGIEQAVQSGADEFDVSLFPQEIVADLEVDFPEIMSTGKITKQMYEDFYGYTIEEDLNSILKKLDDESSVSTGSSKWATDPQRMEQYQHIQKKHQQITDTAYNFPEEADPSLEVFDPGEAAVSYTMGTSAVNKVGWDAALHRDLIMMGEEDFSNLHRQVPVDVAEDYVRWYKEGKLKPGSELPHNRVMSFTALDKPGAQPYGGGFYEGVEIWGTKVQGTYVDPISVYPGEHEVIVKKWTKLEVQKVEEVGKGDNKSLRIYVTRKYDSPVRTPDEYVISKLQKGGDLIWMHGTNVDDDIRRFIPENGSGAHELGMGLYLTVDDRVAEASAKKFRYENVPVNVNYQVGTPHITEVDLTNIRQVINLDDMITKKRFMELFGEALDNVHDPVDVQDFYKYWRDNSDQTVGSVFDTYRQWQAELNGGVDELLNRTFQKDVLRVMGDKYDAGIKGGTMVVYNPERLINKGYREVVPSVADPVLDALESRRFLDHVAEQTMGTDTRRVVRLQSQADVLDYQKQKVAEAYAEEAAKQADATNRLADADEELRRRVRDAQDKKTERVQQRLERGDATDSVGKNTDYVTDLMGKDPEFKKFRGKLEQKLQKKIDRYSNMSPSVDNKAKRKLGAEIEELTRQIDSVDAAVNHYSRVFDAINPNKVKPDWRDALDTVLRNSNGHLLDENWWANRGSYLWSKKFRRALDGVQSFVGRYVSNFLGGDIGKIQRDLHDLKRVGRGHFQLLLAQREAGKRAGEVQRAVRKILLDNKVKLDDNEFARLFYDLAEVQTSPYLVDAMEEANVNIYSFLSKKLKSIKDDYVMSGKMDASVFEQVAEKVQEIPQVYAEVKALADELGINFGDEVTLGYMPRQIKRSTEFWINRGHKGEQVGADFMKSRAAFNWIPEDSQVVDVVMNIRHPGWKEKASAAAGRTIEHFDDLIGDDGAMIRDVFGVMDTDTLDMMNNMGILRKVPFTATESAKFLAEQYQLPFDKLGLSGIYVTDPKRAMEMYSKGLADRAARNTTTFGIAEASQFTMNVHEMDDAAKAVFTVPFLDAMPDSLKSSLPKDFAAQVEPLRVHPIVADELKAMYHVTTNAGLLAQVGDVLNMVYKAGSSMMLSSGRWMAYQELGNAANLIKRNMNPLSFFNFQAARIRSVFNDGVMNFDNVKKVYAGGTMTQQDVYNLAISKGLIESGETFLGSSGKRPSVFNYTDPETWKNVPKETWISFREFIDFTFQTGGHAMEKGGKVPTRINFGDWASGIMERLLSGADTVIDHTTMKYVDFGNRLTDDAFKFSMLENVLRDPGTRIRVPGWDEAATSLGVFTHFGKDNVSDALKYVRENSFMFDEAYPGEGKLRYVIPFWSFHRLNLGETARWIAHNPAKFASYFKLVNSLQSGFNEEDSAAWESVHSNKWFDNQFTVPFKIPGDRSQSGGDEIWTIPSAQLFPSFGALSTAADVVEMIGLGKIKFDFGEGAPKPSQYEKDRNIKTRIQQEGSPFLRQLLGFIDENYLFDYDLSQGYDLDESYPLGMNKKGWATLKMWVPTFTKVINSLPTSVMGRAPQLNQQTGVYTEGVKSAFTGQLPHFTSANTPNYFGKGVFGDVMKNFGLQPMPMDMFLSQGYTMNNITYQIKEAESMMYKTRKELAQSDPSDTKKTARLVQRAQETSLMMVHLQSEYEIYRQWRKINNIPHPKAVKRIMTENLKVSDLLPKAERERIYKENYDKYMNYFTY